MDNLSATLTNAGLSQKEAEIYISLLKFKSATAYKVAKKSSIKRPTAYVILESLRQKGLVLKTPSSTGTIYTAKPPEEFVSLVEQKLSGVLNILPQLKSIFGQNQNNINVFFFEGIKGVEEMLNYKIEMVKDQEIIGFFAKTSQGAEKAMPVLLDWANKLDKIGATIKGITPDDKYVRNLTQEESKKHLYRKLKFVDLEEYSSNISIDTIAGFVRIVDLLNLNGVIIENKEVANTVRQIFEMVWNSLE